MRSPRQIAKAIDRAFQKLPNTDWQQQLKKKRPAFVWEVQSRIYLDAMQNIIEDADDRTRKVDSELTKNTTFGI